MKFSFRTSVVLAFLAGLFLVLAFAPFHAIFLLLICPAVLYALVSQHSPKQAALLGFSFGLGFFGLGASWVFVSIYVFGGTPAVFAGLITVLFVFILSSLFALLGFLLQKYFPETSFAKALVVYPSLWALIEALRSWLFSGFPWLLLGHSLAGSTFSGFAPLFGVYGCSFLIVLASNLFGLAAFPRGGARTWKTANASLFALALLILSAHLLTWVPWSKPVEKPLSVALVQGNIQQSLRWDPQEVDNILSTYQRLSEAYYQKNLIVWPEAAIPLTPEEARPLLLALQKKLLPTHSALLTGMPLPQGLLYTNAVIPLGNATGLYEKRHLVPFGEYVPFEKYLRGLIQFFNLPMSNLVPGNFQQALMRVGQVPIGVYICYEIAYDGIVRSDLPSARFLVTVSDDAWFGDSLAPAQHLQISQFQALAAARPMLVVGNNGITAIVGPKGHLQKRLAQFREGVLTGEIQAYRGATPWVRLGDFPWILLMLGATVFCRLSATQKTL